jgi:PAS domain S-box-containing protein
MYTVLYVDDEPGLLEISKLFLEEDGQFIVDTITSASAALTLMDTKIYDAIISDYQMPGMDGIEFLKKVRSSGNTIPFILFTGRGREEIVIQALNEGADSYLQKGGEPVSQFAELAHQIVHAVKRKRAENELKVSEEKYRRIVETAEEGIWQTDENQIPKTTYVNRRMAEMLGYTPEEMTGRDLTSFMVAEDIPDLNYRREERTQGKSGRNERRLVTKDGKIRWMWASTTPLMDPNGTFLGAFTMYSDITERKTAEDEIARRNEDLHAAYEQLTATEEELRQNYDELAKSQELIKESEKKYRNVVEDQTEFISRFLPDGTHIFVNEAYCRYFGLKRDDIIGHRFRPRIPVEDRERVKKFFTSLNQDHPIDIIENRIIMPDGALRWQWWSDRAIFDSSGTVTEYQAVGRDITEEKITEIALQESEQRNAAMIAALPDILFVLDRDGTYLDFQAADNNLLSVSPDRILGKNIIDAGFDADTTKTLHLAISTAIETGIPQKIEYKLVVPAGNSWFEARLVRLGADRVLGIVRDITERKQTEDELLKKSEELKVQFDALASIENITRLSEERLIMAQNIGLTGCWEFDLTTDKIWGSAEGLRIFGFPPVAGDFSIEDIEACIPERQRVHQALLDLITMGNEYNMEYAINPADGSPPKMIHSVARRENDSQGNVIKIMGVLQDISERKRAEEEIIFKNLVLSTQQETSLNGILIVDEQGKIINFNQKFIEIWEIPPDFIASRSDEPVLQYVVEQVVDPEAFLSRVRYLYDHKDEKSFEEITLKDGRILDRFSAPIIGENGIYYGRVWYFRDISERKRAEDALHLVNRKLNLLTGITRHDILNKISIILGNLKFAEKKFTEPSLVEILKKIESATMAIRTQIEFTRTYQDLGVQAPAWFRVCDVIRSVKPQTISLICSCDSCEIFADPMIAKVFFNLFDNAVKYGMGVTTVTIECRPSHDELIVGFADNGVGILPEEKEHIFERGFGKNTGLGLFLAKEILSITGISIRETGEPGKGARFEIIVPKAGYRFADVKENPGKL